MESDEEREIYTISTDLEEPLSALSNTAAYFYHTPMRIGVVMGPNEVLLGRRPN